MKVKHPKKHNVSLNNISAYIKANCIYEEGNINRKKKKNKVKKHVIIKKTSKNLYKFRTFLSNKINLKKEENFFSYFELYYYQNNEKISDNFCLNNYDKSKSKNFEMDNFEQFRRYLKSTSNINVKNNNNNNNISNNSLYPYEFNIINNILHHSSNKKNVHARKKNYDKYIYIQNKDKIHNEIISIKYIKNNDKNKYSLYKKVINKKVHDNGKVQNNEMSFVNSISVPSNNDIVEAHHNDEDFNFFQVNVNTWEEKNYKNKNKRSHINRGVNNNSIYNMNKHYVKKNLRDIKINKSIISVNKYNNGVIRYFNSLNHNKHNKDENLNPRIIPHNISTDECNKYHKCEKINTEIYNNKENDKNVYNKMVVNITDIKKNNCEENFNKLYNFSYSHKINNNNYNNVVNEQKNKENFIIKHNKFEENIYDKVYTEQDKIFGNILHSYTLLNDIKKCKSNNNYLTLDSLGNIHCSKTNAINNSLEKEKGSIFSILKANAYPIDYDNTKSKNKNDPISITLNTFNKYLKKKKLKTPKKDLKNIEEIIENTKNIKERNNLIFELNKNNNNERNIVHYDKVFDENNINTFFNKKYGEMKIYRKKNILKGLKRFKYIGDINCHYIRKRDKQGKNKSIKNRTYRKIILKLKKNYKKNDKILKNLTYRENINIMKINFNLKEEYIITQDSENTLDKEKHKSRNIMHENIFIMNKDIYNNRNILKNKVLYSKNSFNVQKIKRKSNITCNAINYRNVLNNNTTNIENTLNHAALLKLLDSEKNNSNSLYSIHNLFFFKYNNRIKSKLEISNFTSIYRTLIYKNGDYHKQNFFLNITKNKINTKQLGYHIYFRFKLDLNEEKNHENSIQEECSNIKNNIEIYTSQITKNKSMMYQSKITNNEYINIKKTMNLHTKLIFCIKKRINNEEKYKILFSNISNLKEKINLLIKSNKDIIIPLLKKSDIHNYNKTLINDKTISEIKKFNMRKHKSICCNFQNIKSSNLEKYNFHENIIEVSQNYINNDIKKACVINIINKLDEDNILKEIKSLFEINKYDKEKSFNTGKLTNCLNKINKKKVVKITANNKNFKETNNSIKVNKTKNINIKMSTNTHKEIKSSYYLNIRIDSKISKTKKNMNMSKKKLNVIIFNLNEKEMNDLKCKSTLEIINPNKMIRKENNFTFLKVKINNQLENKSKKCEKIISNNISQKIGIKKDFNIKNEINNISRNYEGLISLSTNNYNNELINKNKIQTNKKNVQECKNIKCQESLLYELINKDDNRTKIQNFLNISNKNEGIKKIKNNEEKYIKSNKIEIDEKELLKKNEIKKGNISEKNNNYNKNRNNEKNNNIKGKYEGLISLSTNNYNNELINKNKIQTNKKNIQECKNIKSQESLLYELINKGDNRTKIQNFLNIYNKSKETKKIKNNEEKYIKSNKIEIDEKELLKKNEIKKGNISEKNNNYNKNRNNEKNNNIKGKYEGLISLSTNNYNNELINKNKIQTNKKNIQECKNIKSQESLLYELINKDDNRTKIQNFLNISNKSKETKKIKNNEEKYIKSNKIEIDEKELLKKNEIKKGNISEKNNNYNKNRNNEKNNNIKGKYEGLISLSTNNYNNELINKNKIQTNKKNIQECKNIKSQESL
ncbi:conserved Plasmodium protein, unknown function, partial [Plasmodium relictum]